MDENEKQRLFFKGVVQGNRAILKKFVTNPKEVLNDLGISEESLKLSPKGLETLKRAEEISKKIQETVSDTDSLTDGLPKITKIIEESIGTNYDVTFEPFGFKFSEEVVADATMGDTHTASIGGTFGSFDMVRPDHDD